MAEQCEYCEKILATDEEGAMALCFPCWELWSVTEGAEMVGMAVEVGDYEH